MTTTAGEPNTFAGSVSDDRLRSVRPDPEHGLRRLGQRRDLEDHRLPDHQPGRPDLRPADRLRPGLRPRTSAASPPSATTTTPTRPILFAGTGFAEATYPYNGDGADLQPVRRDRRPGRRPPQVDRRRDDLDPARQPEQHVDSSGNPLPESPFRDHNFVGDYTYKVVVDPTPGPDGGIIVYAAMGGPTGGLYRSLDGGNTWTLLSGNLQSGGGNAAATDVILDPDSKSPTTGNLDIVYAAFSGLGVYMSTNQGQGLSLMVGEEGSNPLITD